MPGCKAMASTIRTALFYWLFAQFLEMKKLSRLRVCKCWHTMDTGFPVRRASDLAAEAAGLPGISLEAALNNRLEHQFPCVSRKKWEGSGNGARNSLVSIGRRFSKIILR